MPFEAMEEGSVYPESESEHKLSPEEILSQRTSTIKIPSPASPSSKEDHNTWSRCERARKLESSCFPGRGNDLDVKPPKRRRTVEDFYAFCSYILEYENYPAMKNEEMKQNSPSGSTGSLGTDTSYDSTESGSSHGSSTSSSPPQPRARRSQRMQKPKKSPSSGNGESDEEDDHDLVTCYCKKPYAGRPMIECSKCSTWVHLSCAKIRKSNIPEIFLCYKCKEPKHEERQRKEWN